MDFFAPLYVTRATGTGTISPANAPRCIAATAFCCEPSAKSSAWSREIPHCFATRSAVNPMPILSSIICGWRRVWKPPIGTALIISTPPAMTTSHSPVMMDCAAMATVCNPDEQNRFTVAAETSTGNPARNTPMRAMLSPCAPSGIAQPHSTSSTSAGSKFTRCTTALSTSADRSTGCTVASPPSFLPRATAVRTALTMTASFICMVHSPGPPRAARPLKS